MLRVGPVHAGVREASGLVREPVKVPVKGPVESAFIVDLRKFLLIRASKPENRCWAALLEQLLSL
jgi:hypothetical protein